MDIRLISVGLLIGLVVVVDCSDKVRIEIDGETEELPFSLAMLMLNEISSNYLKAMRADVLRQTFR